MLPIPSPKDRYDYVIAAIEKAVRPHLAMAELHLDGGMRPTVILVYEKWLDLIADHMPSGGSHIDRPFFYDGVRIDAQKHRGVTVCYESIPLNRGPFDVAKSLAKLDEILKKPLATDST